jgi:hypothetical protein
VAGYCEGVAEVLLRARNALRRGGKMVVVVNDRRGLYEDILAEAGLRLDERVRRHVNRRTGRRRGEYFEDVLVASAALRVPNVMGPRRRGAMGGARQGRRERSYRMRYGRD